MSDKLKKHIPGASTGWDKFTHWWDFVQAVSNVRMVLSAGPGYYSEPAYGTESWTKEYFSKYDLPIKLAALRRIPYAMLGIEAGPLTDPKARARAAEVFSGLRCCLPGTKSPGIL
jgi:polysaccharide pyruvyl transferase WcaK-like protein